MAGTSMLSHITRTVLCEKTNQLFGRLLKTSCLVQHTSSSNRHILRRPRFVCVARTLTTKEEGQHIIRSPHTVIDVPDTPFTEFMFSRYKQYGDLTAVKDVATGQSYTYKELQEASVRVASGLTRLGVKKGDKILLFATNCPEYLLLFLACGAIGAVVSTANPAYTASELRRQLEHSGTSIVVTQPEFLKTTREAIDKSPVLHDAIKKTVVIGDVDGVMPFRTLLQDDGKAFPENVDVSSDDILGILYSSGTTGLPKGVMLTHKNIVANILQTNAAMSFEPDKDRLLGVLPLYHCYALVASQMCSTSQGATYLPMPRFVPQNFLSAIQDNKITYLHLVPPLVLFMAKDPLVVKYDVSSVHTIVSGAAPLGADLTQQLKSRVSANILQAYGLTETSPVISFDTPPVCMGTSGPLVPNTEAKVVDVNTGKEVPKGETGEICVRGPQVMLGYLDNQQATDDMIKKGWLHTGDIGHFNEAGHLVVTDRLKELIKYKGFQVAPAEMESLLLSHPGIQDTAVLGIPDEEAGEVPRAFVVLKPGHTLTSQDIKDFVKENAAPYKQLRGGVQFVENIPKTPSGKILRRKLKELLKTT